MPYTITDLFKIIPNLINENNFNSIYKFVENDSIKFTYLSEIRILFYEIKKNIITKHYLDKKIKIEILKDYNLNGQKISGIKFEPLYISPSNLERKIYIVYDPTYNNCWRRFVLIKEFMSLYLDFYLNSKLERYTKYEIALAKAFEARKIINNFNNTFEFENEIFSILLTIKLMIPDLNKTLNYLQDKNIYPIDIARKLLIPEFILTTCYQKGYLELLKD